LKYGLVDGYDNGWMHNKVVHKSKKPKFDGGNDVDDDSGSGGSGSSVGGGVKTRSMR
jgi:hypothetical protein